MSKGPTNAKLRWAAAGAVGAVAILAAQRDWISNSRWTYLFISIAVSAISPRFGPRVRALFHVVVAVLLVAFYTAFDVWSAQSIQRSVAMMAILSIPIVLDVIAFVERRKKRDT